jgi:secernin
MLFGKNSDRQRNEAQAVECVAAADHQPGAQCKCTYLAIPQVRHTYAVLICRPFWIWGAEMGANEHGVVIGNEGLRAKGPAPEGEALIGMDLVRLALERATTAAQAVEVVTSLLQRHGQGGNCGHLTPSYYYNGFMIADPTEAFVVETIGREWLVQSVQGARAISNRYSIGRDPELVSTGLAALVRDSMWCDEAKPDYAEVITDTSTEHIGNARGRFACSTALLKGREGRISVADVMRILRDHGTGEGYQPRWQADCAVRRTVCMHAGAEDRAGQTVGSMVSELHRDQPVHWVTGTAAPCLSIFKPVLQGVPLPPQGPSLTDRFDPRTLWWQHEELHRAVLQEDLADFLDAIGAERDALEAEFRVRVRDVISDGDAIDRSHVIAGCWKQALETENRWRERVQIRRSSETTPYLRAWDAMNGLAGLDLSSNEHP